MTGWHLPK